MTSNIKRPLAIMATAVLMAGTAACTRVTTEERETTGGMGTPSASSERTRESRGFAFFSRANRHELAAGTTVTARLTTSLDSGTAAMGQRVEATTVGDVLAGGEVVIPSGSRVIGSVSEVKAAKHYGGQATITVRFDDIETPSGDRVPVEGVLTATAKRQVGKDTATIAGSAVGGAILGEVLGDEAAAGAVVGGGIGTAVAAKRGPEAVLESGREVVVRVRSDVQLEAS
jgi:hypothetical protein